MTKKPNAKWIDQARRSILSLATGCLASIAVMAGAPAMAQDWPSKPVTVIVPYSPGGNTDTMGRLVAGFLTEKFGQTFVVENQPTAGGVIGTERVARAEADGHTLLFGAATMIILRPMLRDVNYDRTDFAPVSILGIGPLVLGVRSSLGLDTFEEFLEFMRENPGSLNFATAGNGGNTHLTTEMFGAVAELDIVDIPYQGGGPASRAFVAGEVDAYFGNASEMLRHIDNPDIKLIATSAPERMEALPDVPAIAEYFESFESTSWNGFLAPKDTPREIIDMIAQATNEAANDPEINNRLKSLGIRPVGSSPEDLAETIEKNMIFLTEAVAIAGLEVK